MAIIGTSVGVGAIVYALSLRTGLQDGQPIAPVDEVEVPISEPKTWWRRVRPASTATSLGFGPATEQTPGTDPESFVYVPVLASPRISWRRRLAGLAGLVVLVAVSALLLAIGIYEVGHLLNQTIERFLGR